MVDLVSPSNSPLNPFLRADIGIESNGSRLTILSVLARLGKDPWAQAALWAQGPKDAAIDGLIASIARMPLSQSVLDDARSTASRLIDLLPTHAPRIAPAAGSPYQPLFASRGLWMILAFLIYLAITWGIKSAPEHNTSGRPAPATHSIQAPK
ncbi:MAG: hypothetical protein M3T55_00815 [Pseudomonadota bacterium]|nr:hypothetical protein [Pseudomonadota bacterium]